MPEDVPYLGWHGEGGDYGACQFACDGGKYAEAECIHGCVLAVRVDDDGNPDKQAVRRMKQYLAVLKRAKALLGVKDEQ
jgi:hypothetical protein